LVIQQEDEGEGCHSNQRTPLISLGVCLLNTLFILSEHIHEQGLFKTLKDNFLGSHLLNLCCGHPTGQIIGSIRNHLTQFGLGDR